MKHPDKFTPQETRNLELEWYEYLLRGEQRIQAPAKRQISIFKKYNGYFLLFGVILLLLWYIASFFFPGLW
jgi:hypothetical protein